MPQHGGPEQSAAPAPRARTLSCLDRSVFGFHSADRVFLLEIINSSASSNGEVEAPGTHASLARRARNIEGVPPRPTTSASRPPPTMVRRRKHRSTVPLATAMRKPKRLQEVGRADVRARNPRPRAKPPSDPILDAVSEDAEATTEDTAARSSDTVSSARARTNRSVHRRVFGRNSWIGAFSSKNEILLRLLTICMRQMSAAPRRSVNFLPHRHCCQPAHKGPKVGRCNTPNSSNLSLDLHAPN